MTNIRYAWAGVQDDTPHLRCTTPQGHGHIWQGTPLDVQLARGRICVVLDGCTTGAIYCNVDEVLLEERKTA